MNIILFGGESLEHEISIITAYQIKEYINDGRLIYINKNGELFLADKLSLDDFKNNKLKGLKKIWFYKGGFKTKFKSYRINSAIIALHGKNGEDGAAKGLLNIYGIPSVGPDILSSAIFMNKAVSHELLKDKGFNVTDFYLLNRTDFIFSRYQNTYPCIIKPNNGGSSIGVHICYNDADFVVNARKTFDLCNEIIVEEYLENIEEYNVAVAKGYISNAYMINNEGDFFSFTDKYDNLEKVNVIVKNNDLAIKLKDIARRIYKEFNLTGIIRVDFLVKENNIYVCELNTIPGGLANYMFDDFSKVINSEIEKAVIGLYKDKKLNDNFKIDLFNISKFSK